MRIRLRQSWLYKIICVNLLYTWSILCCQVVEKKSNDCIYRCTFGMKLPKYLSNHMSIWSAESQMVLLPFKMFWWEPKGRYRCRLCTTIVPFWFSTEHCWATEDMRLRLWLIRHRMSHSISNAVDVIVCETLACHIIYDIHFTSFNSF